MSDDRKMGHVQSLKTYVVVFVSLLALTIITYAAAEVDMGNELINNVIAVAIAAAKATLVTLFFMHGKYEGRITWAFIYFPVLLLSLLLGALFLDYGNRDWEERHIKDPIIAVEQHHGEAGHGDEGHHEETGTTTETGASHEGDAAPGEATGSGSNSEAADSDPSHAAGDADHQHDGGH